ncbi:MAG: KpsF/GutQ family sugar-phosphate isomerase, partial [Candidatus Thorarchaeota archaeon]
MEALEEAKRVLRKESEAIVNLINNLDDSFSIAVEEISKNKKHILVVGVGKSGNISKKIAATFSSTGTPAIYLHPTDALHGDSGVIPEDSICIMISHSGNTRELMDLIPFIKKHNCKIIGVTSNINSGLANESDIVLDLGVREEACPFNLTPTTSSTASLAMGDALAMAVSMSKGFKKEDFARFHPGGSLGKRLTLRVKDVMYKGEKIPKSSQKDDLKSAIVQISSGKLGFTVVLDDYGGLRGIITDGDLRRALEKNVEIRNSKCSDIMTVNPIMINENDLAAYAFSVMEKRKINSLVVLDDHGKLSGVLSLHRLIEEGIGKISDERMYFKDDPYLNISRNDTDSGNRERHVSRYDFASGYIKEGDVVLDCSCGSGYGSEILSNSAGKVIGMDISDRAIEFAKRNHSKENIEFIQQDLFRLDHPEESYDVVVSLETFEHILEGEEWLKKIYKL